MGKIGACGCKAVSDVQQTSQQESKKVKASKEVAGPWLGVLGKIGGRGAVKLERGQSPEGKAW